MARGDLETGWRDLRRRIAALVGGGDAPAPTGDPARLQSLEQRVEHLESLVEGLQDAVHRSSLRHEERMADLERKTEPEAMAKALSTDARRRGL